MKKTILTLITIASLMSAINGHASGLIPEYCTIGNRPVCYPIEYIGFSFDGAIDITGNPVAKVYSGNEPVGEGAISVINYVGSSRTQGKADITFDPPLILPKGNTYTLVVPEGVIFKEGHPAISNDAISVEFVVPETLGEARPSIEEGSVVECEWCIGFFFRIETAPVENGKANLFREGVLVREYDCHVSYDWDLGYAGIDFSEHIDFEDGLVYFENGVRYTVQLPAGCVSALHRSDIVNEEAEVNFIGGSTKPFDPIQYIRCSLFDHPISDVLGEVKFYYDRPVMLCVYPIVQLCNETDGIIVKEAIPTMAEEDGLYVMTVDFDNTPLIPEKRYTIIIPEGTVVTPKGDVIVNHRNIIEVGDGSGISDIMEAKRDIKVVDGTIYIDNTTNGNDIMLYSLDGKLVYNAKSNGGTVSIPVGSTGTYLLSIDGTSYKIAIKK